MTGRGLLRFSSGAALLGGVLASGCLVSFDGYEEAEAGGTGAVGASAGVSNGGSAGLAGSAGSSSGGSAAQGGTAGTGNTGGGGSGGSAGAGNTGGAGNAGGGGSAGAGNAGGTGNTGGGGSAGTGNAGGTGNTGGGGAGGTGNTGGGGTAGTGGSAGATTCPTNLKGPSMSRMTLGGDDFFCVDTTEVTNAQYEEFVTFGSLSGQPTGCGFNTNYAPQMGSSCGTFAYDPGAKPTYPVTCIDWCDAYMFCEWAGKRLCGAISGGAVAAGDRANASVDQWYNACTLSGSRNFPYGNTYTSGRCNDLSSPSAGPFLCGGFSTCSGNYPGEAPVYDMSGNVQEWEDSCSGNSCSSRGGDWLANSTAAACAPVVTANRDVRDHHRGFRCCWDPPSN